MKVLLVTKSLERGGSASGASNLAMALRAAGATVVALDARAARPGPMVRGLRILERIFERLLFNPQIHCLRLGPPVFDLRGLVQKHRPDVVQLCDVSGNMIRFSDLAGLPCPVVHRMSDFWPYHGPDHYAKPGERQSPLARWLMRRTIYAGTPLPDRRVAPSAWLAENLAHGPPAEVIRNAQQPVSGKAARALSGKGFSFGFISNHILDPRKGFHTLKERLEYLSARGEDVTLHLFGRLPRRNIPAFRGVKVVSHGAFARHEQGQVYASFDILLCPSSRDNSPNVLCEAMAHGCPAIAQKGTGMESYLPADAGILLDFQSRGREALGAFAAACMQLRDNYEAMSGQARAFTRKALAPELIGAQYLKLYERLLNAPAERERRG